MCSHMRLLPREHGATSIWFPSLLLAFGTLKELPSIPGVITFLAASVLAIGLTARITGGSVAIVRLERNAILLSILSSLLTLIVPLGQIIMVGQLSISVFAIWIVFLAYCTLGVVYARDLVRSVLKETPPTWTTFSVSATFIVVAIVILNVINWLSIAAVVIVLPLTVHRFAILPLIRRKTSSKIERIREVGFTQAGNLIATAIILALVSKL